MAPPKIPADALKQPNHEPSSPFDVISSAPKPEPTAGVAKSKLALPMWAGRPLTAHHHAAQLDMDSAMNEFGLKMPRQQAEDEAYKQYLYHPLNGQHALAASHHLLGMKAAHAAGENEAAQKHAVMYNHHAKVLGKNPDELAQELGHVKSPDAQKLYKFKAHRGDAFVIQPPEKGAFDKPAPAPELTKSQKEKLHELYSLASEVLSKADAEWRSSSGKMCGSKVGKGINQCQSKAVLARGHSHYCMTHAKKRGYQISADTKKGEASPTKKKHDGHCHCTAYKFCHRYSGGRCLVVKP